MDDMERQSKEQQLHRAVYLEPKTRSTLATELGISEEEIEDLASSLIEGGLLERVEDDPEPRYKYRAHIQDGLDQMPDAGLT